MNDAVPTGDLYPNTYVPNSPHEYGNAYRDVPDYLQPVPEYGPTNNVRDIIERYWSYIVRYPRYIVLGFMWLTYTVYRFMFIVGGAVLLVYLLVHQ